VERPASIPLAEVTRRSEEVGALLRDIDAKLSSPQASRIEQEVPRLRDRLTDRLARTQQAIEARRGLGTLDDLAESWQSSRVELSAWMDVLTSRAVWVEQQRNLMAEMVDVWTRTRTAVAGEGAPQPVIDRVEAVLASLTEGRTGLEEHRATTLLLQDRVARELTRCDEALDALGRARRRAASDLLVRESPPIWAIQKRALGEIPGLVRDSLKAQRAALRRFLEDESGGLIVHGALLVTLVASFLWARARARRWRKPETPVESLSVLVEQPVAAALLLGLLLGVWIYSDEPHTARLIVETGVLVPVVVILRRLVPPSVVPALYALAAFFLVDRLRDFALVFPLVERAIFLMEMLAAAGITIWLVRSGRGKDITAAMSPGLSSAVRVVLRLAVVGFLVAFVSGAVGNMSLARLVGSGILGSGNLALVLGAAHRLAEGVIAFALRVRPVRFLRMVTLSREIVERRAHVVLRVIALTAWVAGTLDYFGVFAPVAAALRTILSAELARGALHISLGDVVAFAVTLWLAFHLASFVRFALEADVFPRLQLQPGVPYALSTFVRYTIVFVGFIVALLVLGVNLDRVTVLGGAFGVGIGFGLQNIVNNFVSGLIVLFERPVRVGDAVQMGDVQGEVVRIGIRSSTVRTGEGAEVIVPNSQLVADKVTNWTPADRSRRLDVPVTVAYGPTPDAVLKVLSEAAHAHPDIVARPAPQILFLGFGDGGLRFELRAWTTRLARFPEVKSELGIAVYGALREAGIALAVPQQELRIRQEPPPAEAVRPPGSAS
jgi:potassium-dependent mechanosensitive channel